MKLARGVMAATGTAAMLAAVPLTAQSINDFRLPGATATTAPSGTQGPVDPDHPVVQERIVRPAASPTPEPSPSQPAAAAPNPAATSKAGAPPRPAGKPAARSAEPARPAASASPNPLPTSAAVATPSPAPAAQSLPQAAPPLALPQTTASLTSTAWPWIAGGLGLLALLFAGLWWRSRTTRTVVVEFEAPVPNRTEPAAAPEPASAAPAPVMPVAARIPEPQLSAPPPPPSLAIALEARRMTASLMATTLSYGLTLTNTGQEPLSALAVEGDMISAHASIPQDQQLASGGQRLAPRHALVTLQPGESVQFSGDFRLPLAEVTPIRAGDVALFVPLARLRVEASTRAGLPLIRTETFVIGELGETAEAGLRPFRLDLGPRTYSRLGQRAVS